MSWGRGRALVVLLRPFWRSLGSEAAGRRALRVSRQRASSRAFELAAPVWEAAAASYGDAARVRWACCWRSVPGFVRRHVIRGRPRRRFPLTKLQAAEGQRRRQDPLQHQPSMGPSARDAKSTANCQLRLPKPAVPQAWDPTESARQPRHRRTASAQAERQPQPQQEAARGARRAQAPKPWTRRRPRRASTPGRGAGAAQRRADAAGPAARKRAARFLVGGAVVLNLVGFVAFRVWRPQPLASTALDAVQIQRSACCADDYDGKARKAYLEKHYSQTDVLGRAGRRRAARCAGIYFAWRRRAAQGGFSYGRNVKGATTLPTRHAAVFPRVRDGDKWRIGNYAFGAVPGHHPVVAALREASRRTLSRTVETSADARAATGGDAAGRCAPGTCSAFA